MNGGTPPGANSQAPLYAGRENASGATAVLGTVSWPGPARRVTNAATEATAMGGPVITSRGERQRRPRPLLRTMIGERLRRTRREQGRTLSDVSRVARVSVPYLSEVERGRKEASSEVLAAICDALWIDLSELLAGVAHDLAVDRARPGTVIRLDTGRLDTGRLGVPGEGRAPSPRTPGEARCLLAA